MTPEDLGLLLDRALADADRGLGRRTVAVPAEQGDPITNLHIRKIGYIDENPVHANRSGDRSSAATNQDITAIGQQAVVTISIADRDCRNPGLARSDEPVTVKDVAEIKLGSE